MIKTRFAPSPTGFLHVGGLRAALFEYLFAKNNGGKFILRIEDTDQNRFVEGGIENILQTLYWAGIMPDEGVILDKDNRICQKGDDGPYIQSQRLDIYKKYVDILIKNKHAYHCFCSKERLEKLRQEQESKKLPTCYDKHCCNLSDKEVQQKLANNEQYVIRMKMPEQGETSFNDLIRGQVIFKNQLIDDQVLIKADGFPTYHLAVVVDDHLMGITHVIRGEEWLPSTPKHVQLYKMFGWEPPQFAHLPLLVNENKQKLSKRHGDVSVKDFQEKGYLSQALVNFIAFLGWNPGDERELFDISQLNKEFSLKRVSKSAAVFNLKKLDWYNQQYIKKMSVDELVEFVLPFLINSGLPVQKADKKWLAKLISLEQERTQNVQELAKALGFVFAEDLEYDFELLVWKKGTKEDAKEKLRNLVELLAKINDKDWSKSNLERKIGEWMKEKDFQTGNVLWPMRVALSGQKNSPGPFEIAEVMGKEKTIKRLSQAEKKLI